MPAIDGHDPEPDEQTREYTEVELEAADPGGDTMIVPPSEIQAEPAADARRVRIVLIALLVLAVAAALIIWGLVR
jgi:hypothetical protein